VIFGNTYTLRPDYTKHNVVTVKTIQYESLIRNMLFRGKEKIIIFVYFFKKTGKTKYE
jgi:hypothetical protein